MSQLSGEDLKKLRESKAVTLEKAAADLRLRPDVLRALENCTDVEILPDIYQKLSLQMYARYLGKPVPGNRPIKSSKRDVPLTPPVELAYSNKLDPKVPQPKRRRTSPGTLIAVAAIAVLAIGLWSLNAKLSRLTRAPKPPVAEAPPPQPVENEQTASTTSLNGSDPLPAEQVTLDEDLFLSLTPPAPPAEIDWH